MSNLTSVASFLRVNAVLPDFTDLVTCEVADDELLELPSPSSPGSGDPPPPPPPKLGGGTSPFLLLYFFRSGSHWRNLGHGGPPGGPEPGGGRPSVIISPAKFIIRIAPVAPCNAPPLAAAGRSPWRPPATAAADLIGGCAIGKTTCCGTGAAIELDAGPDGDSIAAILLSRRPIIATTVESSEFVTWDTGPDMSVAGEGD